MGKNTGKTVLVYVEGGNIQGAYSSDSTVDFQVFDVDNMKADGLSEEDICALWNDAKKDMKTIY